MPYQSDPKGVLKYSQSQIMNKKNFDLSKTNNFEDVVNDNDTQVSQFGYQKDLSSRRIKGVESLYQRNQSNNLLQPENYRQSS